MKKINKNQKTDTPRRRQRPPDVSPEQPSFRRNRTLTGSRSSSVHSAGEGNAQLQSDRTHMHRLVDVRRRVGTILAVSVVAALGVYFLLSQFTATAHIIVTEQPTTMELTNRYEPVVQDYYSKHPIERLRFLLNKDEFTNFLQAKAPAIADIAIGGGSDFASSAVTLTMRRPIASWKIGGTTEFVDNNGVAFQKNYFATPTVTIVDKSGVPVRSGGAVASHRFLGFVGLLVGDMMTKSYQTESVTIPSGTTRQVQLRVKGVPYYIKCSVDRSAGEQAEDIDRVMRFLKKKKITPDYVDVRIEEKAFYQ